MLTEEQIKNLKKGDKVLVEASVENVFARGDVHIMVKNRKIDNTIGDFLAILHSSCLSLPPDKPKHDPCRKFKKGDIVRIVEYKGRYFSTLARKYKGTLVTVSHDEEDDEYMRVWRYDGLEFRVDPAYLELVTPAEKVEPYSVIDSPQTYNIVQAGVKGFTATFYKSQPLAKEGAESHCERLNDEWKWRKEHANEN